MGAHALGAEDYTIPLEPFDETLGELYRVETRFDAKQSFEGVARGTGVGARPARFISSQSPCMRMSSKSLARVPLASPSPSLSLIPRPPHRIVCEQTVATALERAACSLAPVG
jgi:hypothetical protein